MSAIDTAVAALGPEPLTEEGLRRHIDPLFSRVLQAARGQIYLANHSLGRPLDCTADDVQEGLATWYADLDGAWERWRAEIAMFRARVARLIHAPGPHCIAPKASAGQGLRAVLNSFDKPLRVIATRGEFSSIDFILKAYAARERIHIDWVKPQADRCYKADDFAGALRAGADLLVTSLVFFDTGQLLIELAEIAAAAKARGVLVLADLYHAAGAVPVDVGSLELDFAIGGGYKYLRGGPGAAWLYIHPKHLGGSLRTLDTGWFAAAEPFAFERPERPAFALGADGWLESTPAVLPFYQARSGLEFVLAIGVERLRAYSLMQQSILIDRLAERGIAPLQTDKPRGAFIAIGVAKAEAVAAQLHEQGIVADAREGLLRICPDILNSSQELKEGAARIAQAVWNM